MQPYITIGAISIRIFPLMILFGSLICTIILCYSKIVFSCKMQDIRYIAVPSILGAFGGGKVLSLFSQIDTFINQRASLIDVINHLGFVFYGGLIGSMISLWLLSKKTKKSIYIYTDTLFRVLPLAQFFGRIGCFFNGCCYGKVTNSPIGIIYPINGMTIHAVPTQLIEAIFCLLMALTLLLLKNLTLGAYTWGYLISYSLFRFIIENYRGDDIRGFVFGISTSQIISIIIIILGIINAIKQQRRENKG